MYALQVVGWRSGLQYWWILLLYFLLTIYLQLQLMWKREVSQEQLGFIFGSERLTRLITQNFIIANVLIFQTTGSFLLSYGFVTYGGFSKCLTYPYIFVILTAGMHFGALLWSSRYCTQALNPAVTIAHMLKDQKKLPLSIGLLYILCEFVGTVAGTALGFSVLKRFQVPAMTYLASAVYSCGIVQSFFQSLLSSFIFIVLIFVMINPALSYTEIDLQTCFSMTLLYGITAILGNCPLGSNFFLTLVTSLMGGLIQGSWDVLKRAWGLILGPMAGSLLGILFFQYFYLAVIEAYNQEKVYDKAVAEIEQLEKKRRKRSESIVQII